jgi:hypothetical protein
VWFSLAFLGLAFLFFFPFIVLAFAVFVAGSDDNRSVLGGTQIYDMYENSNVP